MIISRFWKKYAFIIIIFLLLFGLILWLAVISQTRITMKTRNEINKKTTDISTLQNKVAKLKKANENSTEINKTYDTVNNLWPDKEEVGKFIVQSEGLASEKNLVLNSITVAETVLKNTNKTAAAAQQKSSDTESDSVPTKAKPKESGIKFSFETESPYNQLFDFIVGMEHLARFNSVSQISIGSGAEDKLVLRLTGYMYAK